MAGIPRVPIAHVSNAKVGFGIQSRAKGGPRILDLPFALLLAVAADQ